MIMQISGKIWTNTFWFTHNFWGTHVLRLIFIAEHWCYFFPIAESSMLSQEEPLKDWVFRGLFFHSCNVSEDLILATRHICKSALKRKNLIFECRFSRSKYLKISMKQPRASVWFLGEGEPLVAQAVRLEDLSPWDETTTHQVFKTFFREEMDCISTNLPYS